MALLFVAEIDDQAFASMSEDTRGEVIEFGGTTATAADKRLVDEAYMICHMSIPIVIMGGVAFKMGGQDWVGPENLLYGVYALPFMLCGFMSSVHTAMHPDTQHRTPLQHAVWIHTSKSSASDHDWGAWRGACCRGVLKALLGLLSFYVFWFLVFMLMVPPDEELYGQL